jgi:hypothetical protein
VIVLDSGGYGPVTITKSIAIVAPRGVYAGISVFSGNGIRIDGAGIDVTLRGLSINGQGGDIGVHLTQASTLVMEDCEIAGMTQYGVLALAANTKVLVRGSVLRNNGTTGLQTAGTVTATLEGVAAFHNGVSAVTATDGTRMTVTGSTLASNGYAAMATSFNGVAAMFVTHSTVADNVFGLDVKASAGNAASIVSDANAITFHSNVALQFQNNGGSEIIYTTGNNAVGYYGTGIAGGSLTPLNPL